MAKELGRQQSHQSKSFVFLKFPVRTRWAMNLLLLLALAPPLICLALLSSLGFLGVLTVGLVLRVGGTFLARIPQRLS
jgi:hypothetical protein